MDPRWTKILEKRRARRAILDTGATSGAAGEEDAEGLIDTGQPSNKTFMFPNGTTQKATKKMMLKHELRGGALEMNIIPGLHKPLISVSKMADAGYTTIFDKNQARVYDASTTTVIASKPPVLIAPRCQQSGLWDTPLEPEASKHASTPDDVDDQINIVFELPSVKETARWHHASAGFPEKETFLRAIGKGNYSSWPGLTYEMMNKHCPDSVESKKGHMKGPRKGIKSTKVALSANIALDGTRIKIEGEDSEPPATEPPIKHNDVYFHVWDMSETIYSDDTGAFPYISQFGKKIIMIAIHVDANYIFAETMKNKSDGERIHAYQKIIDRMKKAKLGLRKHILDNEISKNYKKRIAENGMIHELVPPGNHRRNISERGIQTFKSHLISIVNGVSDDCPIKLWCQFVPQAELTLNLLRQSNITPAISAFAHVHGHHDYMRHPFAPIGCAVEIHVKPENRGTWDMRSVSGFSLGTSLEHYRCYNVYVTSTMATRVSDQVHFRHKYITIPTMSPESYVVEAAQKLAAALKGNIPASSETAVGLTKLGELFNNIATAKAAAAAEQLERANDRRAIKMHPTPSEIVPVPRVDVPLPRVVATIPMVTAPVPRVPTPPTFAQPTFAQPFAPTTFAQREVSAPRPASNIPNFISQDDDDTRHDLRQHSHNTRSRGPLEQIVAANNLSVEIAMMATEMVNPQIEKAMMATEAATPQRDSKQQVGTSWLYEMANSVIGDDGKVLEYKHLIADPKTRAVWQRAFGNELGRLAQGMPGRVEGTNTIFFIRKSDIPADRRGDVTYVGYVVNYRPEKEEKERFRLVVGGDRITYAGDAGTPTADLLTIKLVVNSVVSTPNAKYLTLDLKDFYLNTPMARPEYIRIKLSDIPEDVIERYKLRDIVDADGYVYCRVEKGMYGLPQAGIIAQELLEDRLGKEGYFQSQITPGLWTHEDRKTIFTLVVDDFGIKYVNDADAHHLINAIKKHYVCTVDWEAERYCGVALKWDYTSRVRKVHLTMPNAVQKALLRFNHVKPTKPQYQPYPHQPIVYGAKAQYVTQPIESPKLDKAGTKFIQEVTGVFLFMARAINGRLLPALSALASEQASPTEETMRKCKLFLDCMATEEEMILTYHASDMVLAVQSDASYCSETNSRSRVGGHFYMAGHEKIPVNNGAVLNISGILKHVVSSAAEAEIGGLFINVKAAIPIRQTLIEMGHPQPPTPMQTDNSTAYALITNKIRPKALKSMEMRFNFLKCRQAQEQFRFYWAPGIWNLADYFTKHHAPSHHRNTRSTYLTSPDDPDYTKLFHSSSASNINMLLCMQNYFKRE